MMNRGALALGEWIVSDPDPSRVIQLAELAGSGSTYTRWVNGRVIPGDEAREAIARVTENAVTWSMWDEAAPSADAAVPEPQPEIAPSPALLCELGGVAGTVPPGPLFRAIVDPARPGVFVLAGLGFGLVLDEASAWALRDAATAGLADLRAASPTRGLPRRESAGQ